MNLVAFLIIILGRKCSLCILFINLFSCFAVFCTPLHEICANRFKLCVSSMTLIMSWCFYFYIFYAPRLMMNSNNFSWLCSQSEYKLMPCQSFCRFCIITDTSGQRHKGVVIKSYFSVMQKCIISVSLLRNQSRLVDRCKNRMLKQVQKGEGFWRNLNTGSPKE